MASPQDQKQWAFLPPAYRLPVFILSASLVAFAVWEKVHPPVEPAPVPVGWQGDKVDVKTAEEAPASQLDLSAGAKNPERSAAAGSYPSAPGKPLDAVEDKPASAPGSANPRTEEERSAINERLYQDLEKEKKRMGIVKIIEKDSDHEAARPAAPIPAAPAPAVLILKDAASLQTAWTAAGLPGKAPSVNFPGQMAVFLACRTDCGVASARLGKKSLIVRYKASGFQNPAARVRAVPASSLPAVLKSAE
jgi:hypothetical protein